MSGRDHSSPVYCGSGVGIDPHQATVEGGLAGRGLRSPQLPAGRGHGQLCEIL
jgi:hypothetical protein